MKHSEVISAVIGSTFFAIPYLALSVPILPSLAIGTCAFVAGELVLKKEKPNKQKEISFGATLSIAKKQNKHILEMIPDISEKEIQSDLYEIQSTISKIIKTVEKNPEKESSLDNFFTYYLLH